MLVVTRYLVPEAEAAQFATLLRPAVQALAERPGCTGIWAGRAVEDAEVWTLTSTWRTVGDYRRALSSSQVKVTAVALMYRAVDEPGVFEDRLRWTPHEGLTSHASGLAARESP